MLEVDIAVLNPRFHGDRAVVFNMCQQQHPNTSAVVPNLPPKLQTWR